MDLSEENIKHPFIAELSTSVQQTQTFRTYKLFKDTFICERCIQLNSWKNERSLLAQLRCGILPLRIETGRYIDEPVQSRTCLFCNCSEMETETHFVIVCVFTGDNDLTYLGILSIKTILNNYHQSTGCFTY